MGDFWAWLMRAPGLQENKPTATFSGEPTRPIDQLFAEMRGSTGPVSRAEALSVPAVLKARNLLCSISTLPVVQKDANNNVVRNPLLEQFDPDVPNVVHLAQTVEDLVFEAIAWWRITAFGWDGYPAFVQRVEPSRVSLHPPGGRRSLAPLPSGEDPRGSSVWIDGEEVPAHKVIRFDSPNPAVLHVCARSIRKAIRFDKAAEKYARNPRPLDYFTADVDPESDEETAEFLGAWANYRQSDSTAYVPAGYVYHTVDIATPADLQLVQLQQQAALDIARALGVDPEDLGVSTTSRTYANVIDRRIDKVNEVLSAYMRAITDRLSMPDVTKRGYLVSFDLREYMRSNPTERIAYYKAMQELGVMDSDDIAAAEGLPPKEDPEMAPDSAGTGTDDATTPALPETESVDASGLVSHQFNGDGRITFTEACTAEFSVDREARTIEGLALPYGKIGMHGGMKFRFRRGSLQWSDPKRVKLLQSHDFDRALGHAVELKDTAVGLRAKFKVARGPEGDRALELAEDGVLDGLSVGVDFDPARDTDQSSRDRSVMDVIRGDLREVSLTPMPAFDDARVTRVAAERDGGMMDKCATCGTEHAPNVACPTTDTSPAAVTPIPQPLQFSDEQLAQLRAALGLNAPVQPAPEARPTVNPTRLTAAVSVNEALPYRFDRRGNFIPTEHVFSADLHEMARANDEHGTFTAAGKRVIGLLRATFADVDSADVTDLNPTIQRPDLYVDQRDYRYPLWEAVNKGTPPNGINPFRFPKFNTASGLVGDHTQGTEPTAGTFTTTGQTVTPTALSGKAEITREVWDMGGNPAVSTLIFNQMVRGYREGLESATATFLNTLTAATDINLGVATVNDALADAYEAALADLQFVRGYDFSVFALEKALYKAFVAAEDTTGRPLYPILGPTNTNGTAASRFRTLDLSGVTGIPSWALASVADAANNSWLFDPSTVHGWATAPQRLEFPGTSGSNAAPVAYVDLAIWGYKAFANSDIGGVRQVIYDATA